MKTKRPYADAIVVVCKLVDWLQPACERIEIAGSIRRHKDMIGDIEIVCVAKPILNLFGEPTEQTYLDIVLSSDSTSDLAKNGPRYKQFTVQIDDQPWQVDLFLATPENWGLIYMIRTGSAEFVRKMVISSTWGGYKPPWLLVEGGQVIRGGVALPVPEEEILFGLWGMDYVEPEARI